MAQIPFADNLIGEVTPEEKLSPEGLAGLGLGGGFYANQIAQNTAARQGFQLVGQPQTTSTAGRLMGGTPPQYTGATPPPRVTPGTQIVPTGQAPATTGSSSIKPAQVTNVRTVSPTGTQLALQGSRATRLGSLASPAALYTLADMGVAAVTGKGISERVGEFSGNVIGGMLYDQDQPAFTPEELGQAGQGTVPAEPAPASVSVEDFNRAAAEAMAPVAIPTVESLASLPQAAQLPQDVQPSSPQATFLAQRAKGELTPQQIAQAEQFAASMGTTFDPQTGYSRDPFLSNQASRTSTPLPGQTLSQFMRYEDQPIQRTEQFVDPQGRLRSRATPAAAQLMGLPQGVQPLAPQYSGYEAAAADREARLAARPDFMEAQPVSSRAGQTISQAEASDLAKAQMPGASASDIARGMQVSQRVAERTKEEPTQANVETIGDREYIRQPDGSLQALKPIEGPFVPSVIDAEGGGRIIQLGPNHSQFVPEGTSAEVIKDLQDKLSKAKEGSVEQFSQQADALGFTGRQKTAFILSQMGLGKNIEEILGVAITGSSGEGGTLQTGESKDSLGLGL